MHDQPKSHFERFLRPILASRFLTVSALIHLLVIVLFGGKVLFNRYVEIPPDIQAPGDTTVTTNTPPSPPAAPQIILPAPPISVQPAPPAPASLPILPSLNNSNPIFPMPVPPVGPPHDWEVPSSAPQSPALGTGTPGALPGPMIDRTGPGVAKAAETFGQKPSSALAVLRALRWLQSQQSTDGTWGSDAYRGAFTGLALLCFLGHGETPATSPEFGVVVSNAIDALVTEGNRNHGRFSFGNGFDGNAAAYMHGICTYALCEAYAMTKDPRLVPIIKDAVDYIVKGQRPDGGWAYSYDLTSDAGSGQVKSDTSVSGWQIQALKAAHLTGIPGMEQTIHPVLELAMKNIDRVFNPKDGSFGYRVAGDKAYSLTGVGVLSKLFWLGRADHQVHEGLKNIESKDLSYTGVDCNLYAWFYDTQACFQAQGGSWDWWNGRFQRELDTNQSQDGSWPPTNGADVGDFAKAPGGDGPVYRTTLCCLMLEVYYRYLPTSKDTALSGGVEGL